MDQRIPPTLIIGQTAHWTLNHRIDSALPGYLMVSARVLVDAMHELSPAALAELGPLLAHAQQVMHSMLGARRVYVGRYGHTPGWSLHFHVIPIYDEIEKLFWNDARYRALQAFSNPAYSDPESTDGAELTFFVWREFCESEHPPSFDGLSVSEAIARLRDGLSSFFVGMAIS